jgi:dihydrofolate reductase
MRKLKLQMQMSLDGFIAVKDGGIPFNWDAEVRKSSVANTRNVDCILLGRKTAKGFIPHWATVAARPSHPDYAIGKILTDTPKIVFSRTLAKSKWENATLSKGQIVKEITRLKNQSGKDILVYGGVHFASSLARHRLIDEYYLLVNPVAIGKGLPLFSDLKKELRLALVESRQFSCGTVMLCYKQKHGKQTVARPCVLYVFVKSSVSVISVQSTRDKIFIGSGKHRPRHMRGNAGLTTGAWKETIRILSFILTERETLPGHPGHKCDFGRHALADRRLAPPFAHHRASSLAERDYTRPDVRV